MAKKNRATDRAERAAVAMKEAQRQESRRRNLMVGGVVVAILAIVVVGFLISRSLDDTNDVAAPAAGSEFGLTVGPADAPDKVVIYEDFLCPFCGDFEEASRDRLSKLAEEGELQVEYRPFNLLRQVSDYSERAAGAFSIVLEKSGPDVAKKYHDLLFDEQPSESGPYPDNDALVDLAVEAGADEADVRGPIEDNAGKEWVDGATKSAQEAGVQGTPTILVNGEVFQDGRTVDELADNLVAEIEG